jgi:putative colanic acid biosynthesis acetyltransferase WcaF
MHDLRDFRLPPGFRGKSALFVQLWWLIEAVLFRPSPQTLYGWRRLILRLFGSRVGVGVRIRPTARITYPWKVEFGNHVWIGDNVTIYSLGHISIGESSVISQDAYLCAGSHRIDSPAFDIYSEPIKIGASVWVAAGAFVAPGVTIGEGAVIGARSAVFKDVPSMSIWYGSPATFQGVRTMSPAHDCKESKPRIG